MKAPQTMGDFLYTNTINCIVEISTQVQHEVATMDPALWLIEIEAFMYTAAARRLGLAEADYSVLLCRLLGSGQCLHRIVGARHNSADACGSKTATGSGCGGYETAENSRCNETSLARFSVLHHSAVSSTETTLPPCKFLTSSISPITSLSSTMCLAQICTPLSTLQTAFKLAALPPTMPYTAISTATCTLCAARNNAPLSTTMSHTEVCASMYTFWANATATVKATLPPTMCLAQWGAPFSTFGTTSK
ncbi:hypothetical protein Lal_00021238 [Lupinus albus]|nr:hypothetical protein Lal_00021238 [Lupinus albus]